MPDGSWMVVHRTEVCTPLHPLTLSLTPKHPQLEFSRTMPDGSWMVVHRTEVCTPPIHSHYHSHPNTHTWSSLGPCRTVPGWSSTEQRYVHPPTHSHYHSHPNTHTWSSLGPCRTVPGWLSTEQRYVHPPPHPLTLSLTPKHPHGPIPRVLSDLNGRTQNRGIYTHTYPPHTPTITHTQTSPGTRSWSSLGPEWSYTEQRYANAPLHKLSYDTC